MTALKIAFVCGSLRDGSINKKLEGALIKRFTRAGADCRVVNLGDYNLPLYHGDLDLPDGVNQLSADLNACAGVVIVSPEYNGGLPALVKNAIDWMSTTDSAPFKGRYWGIAACSPGPMSGIMCMRQINYILMRVGSHVSPIQVGVGRADNAFDDAGELTAEPSATLADNLITDMFERIEKYAD